MVAAAMQMNFVEMEMIDGSAVKSVWRFVSILICQISGGCVRLNRRKGFGCGSMEFDLEMFF